MRQPQMDAELKTDFSRYPARVRRAVAMELLGIPCAKTFAKVVDALPELVHRLPGERRNHYHLHVIQRLLEPQTRCAAKGEAIKRKL